MQPYQVHTNTERKWDQIFVFSLPRAGSTLLRLLLDTHPSICCPGELDLGNLVERLHHSLYFSSGQLLEGDETERSAWTARQVRTTIEGFMKPYAKAKGKQLWAEKTPANLAHAEALKRTFPDAAFLCLHRHPLDLIRSGFESTRFGKLKFDLWDYQSGVDFCVEQTQALLQFEKANPNRCFRLRYEDIVQDGPAILAQAFHFLGLESDPEIVNAAFMTKHERGPGDPKAEFAGRIYNTSIGRGAEIVTLLSDVSSASKNRLKDLIVELGYPPTDLRPGPPVEKERTSDNGHTMPATFRSVEELFLTHFPARLQRKNDLQGSVKFLVKGNGGGTWTIKLDKDPAVFAAVNEESDCTITIRSDDLLKLATGELNVGECYLQAKLRVAGNEALAISLGRSLFA
ncbi:MAG TPA: sulfotransferase [Pyrinomonadaceae bacterium]|nr:sulfotransferase [Pyrinomonadaceae bacterium]